MAATIPRFAVRDPARTCWTCEHAQILGYDTSRLGPPPWTTAPPLIGRWGTCGQKALMVSMVAPTDTSRGYAQQPGYNDTWLSDQSPMLIGAKINDLSKNWCSQWRRSSLPVPEAPL